MTLLRWTLVLAVLALLVWWLTPQPPAPLAEPPWGPGKNVFDCEHDAPVQPLDPTLTPAQRARVLALLREACHPTR